MKKIRLDSLELDKETIARLDIAQINEIIGGINDDADETNCVTVGPSCGNGGSCNARP